MARRRKEDSSFFSKKNLVGLFIVAIMVLSGVGYLWVQNSGGTATDYKGHQFVFSGDKWYTKIDSATVGFTYHPADLERINISPELMEYIKSVKMFYITFEPNSSFIENFEILRMELETELPQYFNIYPTTGVTFNSSVYSQFPIVTCQNATVFVPVIYLRQGETTEIIPDGSCIILQARDVSDVPALKDRLMYGLFGIM
jgi:hypothetical protein